MVKMTKELRDEIVSLEDIITLEQFKERLNSISLDTLVALKEYYDFEYDTLMKEINELKDSDLSNSLNFSRWYMDTCRLKDVILARSIIRHKISFRE